jgi:hypothetical protein
MFLTPAFAVYVFLTMGDVATTLSGTLSGLTEEANPVWAWSLPGHPIFFSIARMLMGIVMIAFFYSSSLVDRWCKRDRTRLERDLMVWISNVPLFMVVLWNCYQIHSALNR